MVSCTQWNNEDRTLEMERETYQKIQDYMASTHYGQIGGQGGTQTDFAQLEDVLKQFNATQENAGNTADFTKSDLKDEKGKANGKLAILRDWLKGKYTNSDGTDISLDSGNQGYLENKAAENRNKNFNGLKPTDYPSAMLPTG